MKADLESNLSTMMMVGCQYCVFFFFSGHKQLSERRVGLVQETLNQEPCAAEPYILSKLHFVSISSFFLYLFMYLFI